MLPFYQVDVATGVWRFNGQSTELISSLDTLSFADYCADAQSKESKKMSLIGLCAKAEQLLEAAHQSDVIPPVMLGEKSEHLCWFMIPEEVGGHGKDSGLEKISHIFQPI